MGSIPAEGLIRAVEGAMGWPYVSPGSNDSRGIDCSGLLVYAYTQFGQSIYHGSNTIYRKYCRDTAKLTSEKQLTPGMAVFKWNANTPSKFSDGLGDFQHVGVVTRVKPLRIVHASSAAGKVVADIKLGKWTYCGYLKAVEYGGENMGILEDIAKILTGPTAAQPATTPTDLPTTATDLPETDPSAAAAASPQPAGATGGYTRTVTAQSGSTVNVRETPGGAKKAALALGTQVRALGGYTDKSGTEWTEIEYPARGWMMSKYLRGGD